MKFMKLIISAFCICLSFLLWGRTPVFDCTGDNTPLSFDGTRYLKKEAPKDWSDSYTFLLWACPKNSAAHPESLLSKVGYHTQISYRKGIYSFSTHNSKRAKFGINSRHIPAGVWTFVVAVYDKHESKIILYINGAQVAEKNLPDGQYKHTGSFIIGCANPKSKNPCFYTGKIDRVRVYTSALNADEIKALYNKERSTYPVVDKTLTFKHANVVIDIDKQSGTILKLTRKGLTILDNPGRISGIYFNGISSFKLKSYKWDNDKGVLVLVLSHGNWILEDHIIFNDSQIKRYAKILSSKAPGSEPDAFNNLIFHHPLVKHGRYFSPATLLGDARGIRAIENSVEAETRFHGKDRIGKLQDLVSGSKISTAAYIWPQIVEYAQGKSVMLISDARKDRARSEIKAGRDYVDIMGIFKCSGWALPNVAQTVGPVYLLFCDADAETTLKLNFQKWCSSVGIVPPEDRPEFVYDAIVYSFFPGGRGIRSKNAFANSSEYLFPRLQKLGFNALWILPVTTGSSVYTPFDYCEIRKDIGGLEEYRNMIKSAHHHSMRVWQDIVPHGGYYSCGLKRGDSVLSLVFKRDGSVKSRYAWDYNSPEWNDVLRKAADFYLRNGVDGFRIDMPGNGPTNWRREGFPSENRVPKGADPQWWKLELAKTGGKLPPYPEERGSLQGRGGMKIVGTIRKEVKKFRPEYGITLAENPDIHFVQAGDAIYDFMFRLNCFKLPLMSSSDFVVGLSRWLEEQELSSPPGTMRLRYVDSHDSFPGRYWLGIAANRALTALSFLIKGIPMVSHKADLGNGFFLKRLIEIRKALPELSGRGLADYTGIKTSSPGVLVFRRTLGKRSSLILINFNPETVKVDLSSIVKSKLLLFDVVSNQKINDHKLALGPWKYAVLTNHSISGNERKQDPPSLIPCPPTLTEDDKIITVKANYELQLDRKTGLLHSFDRVLSGSDLILAAKTGLPSVNIIVEKRGDNIIINAESALYKMKYTCTDKEVRLDASLSAEAVKKYAGLYFFAAKADYWRVNTVEGVLEDLFSTPFKPSFSDLLTMWGNCRLRPSFEGCLYDAAETPLNFNAPQIRVGSDKNIIEFEIAQPGANPIIFNEVGDRTGFALNFPFDGKKKLNLILRRASGSMKDVPAEMLVGDLKVQNCSYGWKVKNKHYALTLLRNGGGIIELRDASGNLLLSRQEICSERGLSRKSKSWNISNINCGNGSVKIYKDNDSIVMRFGSLLRARTRNHTPDTLVWSIVEYRFNESGCFRMNWHLLAGSQLANSKPIMGWQAVLPGKAKALIGKNINVIKNGKKLFCLDNLDGAIKPRVRGGKIELLALDENDKTIIPRKWYSYGMTVNTNPAKQYKIRNISEQKKIAPYDLSFETVGATWSVKEQRAIAHRRRSGGPGFWISSSPINFSSKDSCDGLASVLLPGSFRIPLPEVEPGKVEVSCKIKGKDIPVGTSYSMRIIWYDENGKSHNVDYKVPVNGNFAWKKVAFKFELPPRANSIQARCAYYPGIDGKEVSWPNQPREDAGHLWVDDFELKTLKKR